MSAILRYPALLFSFGVDRLRRLPGARLAGSLTKWLARLMLLGALVLTFLWAAEASPQRISLAELRAGRLGQLQSWIIVTGELADEQGSTATTHAYRLTDPAVPKTYLDVHSPVALSLGYTTVSGRVEGGADGVPEGYQWSARLNADRTLAAELPPPWTAFALAALGVLIILARRTRYPMFVGEAPMDVQPATGTLRVSARRDSTSPSAATAATLSFANAEPGAADLALTGKRTIPVRLHSAFTKVDVGRLRTLRTSAPALRVRSDDQDLALVFGSARDRDTAFAALRAETQLRREPQASRAGRVTG